MEGIGLLAMTQWRSWQIFCLKNKYKSGRIVKNNHQGSENESVANIKLRSFNSRKSFEFVLRIMGVFGLLPEPLYLFLSLPKGKQNVIKAGLALKPAALLPEAADVSWKRRQKQNKQKQKTQKTLMPSCVVSKNSKFGRKQMWKAQSLASQRL